MATLQTNPSQVPNAVQEWTRELNITEISRVGYKNVNLTLWDETSTSIPYILEGSTIEIANSTYVEESTVILTGATPSVINWVIYIASGSTATASLTSTAPTASDYDIALGGFYNGSGHRYTGHYMLVSGAGTAFSNKGYLDYANGAMLKYRIDDEANDFVVDAKLRVKETLNVDSDTTVGGDLTITGTVIGALESENGRLPSGFSNQSSQIALSFLYDKVVLTAPLNKHFIMSGGIGYYLSSVNALFDISYGFWNGSTLFLYYILLNHDSSGSSADVLSITSSTSGTAIWSLAW
jgi:hypothetical protein